MFTFYMLKFFVKCENMFKLNRFHMCHDFYVEILIDTWKSVTYECIICHYHLEIFISSLNIFIHMWKKALVEIVQFTCDIFHFFTLKF